MSETLNSNASEGRKGDGAIIVVQDNDARELRIEGINEAAAEQLAYSEAELKSRRLEAILGQRTAQALDEDLEYADDAPDLFDILSRHREVRFRTKSGQELAVATSIHRVMAEDKHARFQIILPDEREVRARDQLRTLFARSLEGHQQLDEATGLPNRATVEGYLRSIGHYMTESDTQAAFAVLRIDRFEKSVARYGKVPVNQIIQHVGNCCRSTFRAEDVVCVLGGPYLGLLLVDISRESVRVVLNRLRWNIRTHTIEFGGKADFSTTVSIAFDMLGSDNSDALLEKGEKAVAELDADARNLLIELVG